jgi:hypothetical protein
MGRLAKSDPQDLSVSNSSVWSLPIHSFQQITDPRQQSLSLFDIRSHAGLELGHIERIADFVECIIDEY